MRAVTEARVIHSYDVAARRIRCEPTEPGRSTKHASGVTCATCRELLLGVPRPAARAGAASDATLGG